MEVQPDSEKELVDLTLAVRNTDAGARIAAEIAATTGNRNRRIWR